MTDKQKLQQSMNTVMQAFGIMADFHQNIADLFRVIIQDLEEAEPAYTAFEASPKLWTSGLSSQLRSPKDWQSRHFAMALHAMDEEIEPIILLDVSLDKRFNESPELWLGLIYGLEQQFESFPWPEATEYIFKDYLGPEDSWDKAEHWYTLDIEDDDDDIQVELHFCRVPLHLLTSAGDVHKHVSQALLARIQESQEQDAK